jgi:O-antigen ligase
LRIALWGHIIGGVCLGVVLTTTIVSNDFRRVDITDSLGLNLAARLVALTLIFAVILYQLETGHISRCVLVAAAILAALSIVISLSRGSWYAAIVSGLAFVATLMLKGDYRIAPFQLLGWCVVPLVVLFLLDTFFLDQHAVSKLGTRFVSAVTFNDGASDRFEIWRVGWLMFLDSPLCGHGIASFPYKFPAYIGASGFGDIFYAGVEKQPHNAHVRVTTEYGMVGLVFWFGILISTVRRVSSQYFNGRVNPRALAACMALIAFLFVSSTVDSSVDRKYLWYCLSLITLFMTYWGHSGSD